MQRTRQVLANDIEERKNKLSILDKIAFTSEQDGKRIQQQVQQLTAQKDRIEKLIANISNGAGYSKLRQIIKENVRDILSENKTLISVSFVALIQTIKADPEMVKLIQNITSANDSEQNKENNNNIIKYLQSNKEGLLDLSEKNYENLVEAFTNNVENTASSSNTTLSLPQTSFTLQGPLSQSDSYRIENQESFHNSKGDIAD